jgi:membrane dipeptidase
MIPFRRATWSGLIGASMLWSIGPSTAAEGSSSEAPGGEARRRAEALLDEHPVIDGHNDLPMAIRESRTAPRDVAAYDLRKPTPGDSDLGRMRQGRLGAQFWSVWVPSSGEAKASGRARALLEQFDIALRMIERYPESLQLALTADDIEEANAGGRIASLLGIEGGHTIENSLGALRIYHRLGARYMTLTHTDGHDWADATGKKAAHGGLTRFGEEVVREMNRIGMLVDISHVSPDTMRDVLDIAEAPVIFSHSNALALSSHERNVPDDVLQRLPRNGGIVMVSFIRYFLAAEGEPRPTVAHVADHVEHVRKLAGPDHVGIGSDFYGEPGAMALGLEDTSMFPALFAELIRRGWRDEDLIRLSRGNVLRVVRGAERAATRIQATRTASNLTIEQLDHGMSQPPPL